MGFEELEIHEDSIRSARKSVKWLEVPIQKFNDIVPHFVESLRVHQNNILKLRRLEQWEEVRKEKISATQIINQLASLLSEMENLRSEVTETDLAKFDRLVGNSKQSAKAAIRSFHEISSKSVNPVKNVPGYFEETIEEVNTSMQEQLMAVADLTETLKVHEQRAASMERLQEDIQDINFMFQELSQMVHEQGEAVEQVETHVETTHHHITQGERMLAQAARYKSGTYPLLGALLGSIMGGPVGLFAGYKLGGLAAVGAGFLGFTGGKILKNQEEVILSASDRHSEELKNKA